MDAFDILGLSPAATQQEVRAAYRRASLKTHPDRGGDAAAFRSIADAADAILNGTVSDPQLTAPEAEKRLDVIRALLRREQSTVTVCERRASCGAGDSPILQPEDGESLLCCCLLGEALAAGTSKGRLLVETLNHGQAGAEWLAVALGRPIFAVSAPPPEAGIPPMLVASVAGEATVVDVCSGSHRSLSPDIFGTLHAESISLEMSLSDADSRDGAAGGWRCLALWDVEVEAPVFAVASTVGGGGGGVVAAACADGVLHLLCAGSGALLGRLRVGGGEPLYAESLFSGGYDAAVTVWRLPPPPRPREIRDATAECLTCPAAASCSRARLKSAVVGNSDRGGGQCRSAPPRQAQEQHRGIGAAC
ncbi:hypothetical protein EMIHUDRAFT_221208 [Emiliania huxleyi CCMP1516]|uniref:J domain-containing protein n=2 Tax=Emiliania huxleyi TaxID=2903 RepID=A0A0D3HZG2_EMIH1|nr:hypothetical protein EMIHUDRAFT_221208 [Emiliania huxleyi CCMP1516]EOD04397.1 hypothetical protein EMIHUDRAFT_221208 [Emiliania huxleyi CCMP1516]|eukprot:XP_005756826.1 hypothetical protein EMIHUDRAFT_221208 [Emiliania huxleyi CCMP1516]